MTAGSARSWPHRKVEPREECAAAGRFGHPERPAPPLVMFSPSAFDMENDAFPAELVGTHKSGGLVLREIGHALCGVMLADRRHVVGLSTLAELDRRMG